MTQTKEKLSIHRSQWGTYHPNPSAEIAWTVNDTRGYMDAGPECYNPDCEDSCECYNVGEVCECPVQDLKHCYPDHHLDTCDYSQTDDLCIGLSFAYVCLDGGEAYCEDCVDRLFDLEVIDCDCD